MREDRYLRFIIESDSLKTKLEKLIADETPSVETLVNWFGREGLSKNDYDALTANGFDPKKTLISKDRIKELSSQVEDSLKKQKAAVEREFSTMFSKDVIANPEEALKAYPREIRDTMLSGENLRKIDRAYEDSMKSSDSKGAKSEENQLTKAMKGICRILYIILGEATLREYYPKVIELADVPDDEAFRTDGFGDENSIVKEIGRRCLKLAEGIEGALEKGKVPSNLSKIETELESILGKRNSDVKKLNQFGSELISKMSGSVDSIVDDRKFLQFIRDANNVKWNKSN